MSTNVSGAYSVPCSCYNTSVTNNSTTFDLITLSQFSLVGSLVWLGHGTDLCTVPANSHTYREVGRGAAYRRGRTAGRGAVPRRRDHCMWSASRVELRERTIQPEGRSP